MTLLIWLVNGILASIYVLFEHLLTVFLAGALAWGWFNLNSLCDAAFSGQFRPWMAACSILAVAVSILAPPPVPFFQLVMAGVSLAAIRLEKFNPAGVTWTLIGGLFLYSLLGTAFLALTAWLDTSPAAAPMLAQGQTYLGVLVAVALYGYPAGYLAVLVKGIFIHPPVEDPQKISEYIRTRGAGGR